jgi:dTDP-4-dehydrorhamnose 3,5-epimerase
LQDNLSFSATKGTMRGLHFQCPPFAQVKLLTVLSGAILDVVVDLRSGSPTFGKHFAVKLSADDGTQIFIPEGFAHGFYTHAPNTLVFYKASKYYSPDYEAGIRWDDESLNIDWGADPSTVTISDRDSKLPAFDPLADYFGDL